MSKTIFITGSTDGIGKLLSLRLATEGHTLILHGRSAEKLSAVVAEIQKTTEYSNISTFVADFSNLADTQKMAKRIRKEQKNIDVIINNAGIFKTPVQKTADGFDVRIAVNYFAPYLLTNTVLPLLEASKKPRIINLSSAAQAPVSRGVLLGETTVSDHESYAQSKLAITMWNFYMAKKYPHITTIAVNPGSLLHTKMATEAYGQHWSTAEKGSNILYDLSVLDKYDTDTGKYFDNDSGGFGNAHPDAYDVKKIQNLVQWTNDILLGV